MIARLLVVALAVGCAGAPARPATFAVAQIRADMAFLASDELQGRRAGTREYDIAARYVAARLELMGIASQPQPVALRQVTPDVAQASAELSDPRLAAAVRVPDNALVTASPAQLAVDVSGPMTYVGKGVCDAGSGRDDAAGVDLTGRFAVILAGVPAGLPPERAAVRAEIAAKWACVARHGAIGLVSLRTPKATVQAWPATLASYRSGAMALVEDGVARSRLAPAAILVLDVPAARAVLATVGRDLEAEEAQATVAPVELPGTLRLRYRATARDLV